MQEELFNAALSYSEYEKEKSFVVQLFSRELSTLVLGTGRSVTSQKPLALVVIVSMTVDVH
jgi:hypothetical protein